MKHKCTIVDVLVSRANIPAQQLVVKYGYQRAQNNKELADKLNAMLIEHREKALAEMATIHPDRELILTHGNHEYKNACGCGSNHSSANGEPNDDKILPAAQEGRLNNATTIIAVVGILALVAITINKG